MCLVNCLKVEAAGPDGVFTYTNLMHESFRDTAVRLSAPNDMLTLLSLN